MSKSQDQTESAFNHLWQQRDTYESEAVQKAALAWLVERYGPVESLVKAGDKVLDAGCGGGYSALAYFGPILDEIDYVGVDISEAAFVAQERLQERGTFIQADIMDMPVPDDHYDLVFSEGVLHHTDDTFEALKAITKKAKIGGLVAFYVYRKKGWLREFFDDAVRAAIGPLSDRGAWMALWPLTVFGAALGRLCQPVQRWWYYNVFKAFYRRDYTLPEMHNLNFDWYRPTNCHRQTCMEVMEWLYDLGLSARKFTFEDSGITVVARREQ